MNCLILAFENFDDLPKNWHDFSRIDAYGFSIVSVHEIKEFFKNSNIEFKKHDKFFEIKDFKNPEYLYDFCYIRHPDPWGEPRNWMQAIAGLGECLKGRLVCEFWQPNEIIAFNFLLNSFFKKGGLKFLGAKQIENIGEWENYQAGWEVKQNGAEKNMLEFYQKNKKEILQKLYQEVGKSYDMSISLDDLKI